MLRLDKKQKDIVAEKIADKYQMAYSKQAPTILRLAARKIADRIKNRR